MSARPSARYQPGVDALQRSVICGVRSQQLANMRAIRAEDLRWIRELFEREPNAEFYSVPIAAEIGGSVGRAAGLLHELEVLGVLESRLAPSPISGLGRRYYRARAAR